MKRVRSSYLCSSYSEMSNLTSAPSNGLDLAEVHEYGPRNRFILCTCYEVSSPIYIYIYIYSKCSHIIWLHFEFSTHKGNILGVHDTLR